MASRNTSGAGREANVMLKWTKGNLQCTDSSSSPGHMKTWAVAIADFDFTVTSRHVGQRKRNAPQSGSLLF
jgi:hypothetical protein